MLMSAPLASRQSSSPPFDPIRELVAQLDLERYKGTIKGLTAFGDRLQGTDRNRAAIDWIEARLRESGCAPTERLHYTWSPPAPPASTPPPRSLSSRSLNSGEIVTGIGGSRLY